MTTLIPLSSLADPTAFLQGARVPLVQPSDPSKRWECINGTLYEQMGCSFEAAVEYDEAADQDAPSRAAIRVLALDPSDPDVARHCDRRIAEHGVGHPCYMAILQVVGHAWDLSSWSDAPSRKFTREVQALDGIPCTPEHIPTARAALVLALYGTTP